MLPGLAGRYLQFCAEHLDELEDSILRRDVTAVSHIAHAINGNAKRIGLSELSSLGRQLEEYCLGGDWRAIDSAFRAIAETVFRLCGSRPLPVEVAFEPNGDVRTLDVRHVS